MLLSKMSTNKTVVAITGGIATGKTTVAKLFTSFGCEVIGADEIARDFYTKPEFNAELSSLFPEIPVKDGMIIKSEFSKMIFSNDMMRDKLNHFIIPKILEKLEAYINSSKNKVIYIDCALVFEWGIDSWFDVVIVVDACMKTRIKRIVERDKCDELQAQKKIDAQLPQQEKLKKATFTIDNHESETYLIAKVRDIIEKIEGENYAK